MELLMTIQVGIKKTEELIGHTKNICMLEFDGTARGIYFNGEVIGTGVDTQKIEKDGSMFLSARYMLEGLDMQQNPCRVFIENNGGSLDDCTPVIYTDSPLLADWEGAKLKAKVTPCEGGVTVKIFKIQ